MEKSLETPVIPLKTKIQRDRIVSFFLMHLNLIYCAKSYLVKQLPEIEDLAEFRDLKFAIAETTDGVKKQITRMRKIFTLLDAEIALEQCKGMIGLVEETYAAVRQQNDDPWLRDMSILYYLQNIESIEMASFGVLNLVAAKLKDDKIKQLIRENYDEAKEDRALMTVITARYLSN